MGNPVVALLQAALLSVTVAGYSLAVTLPRMLAAGARGVWRVFGAAPAARAPGGEPARPVYAVVTAPRDLASAWRETLAEQSRLLEEPERFLIGRLRRANGATDRRDGLGPAGVVLYPVLVASLVVVILVTAALCLVPVLSALLVWGWAARCGCRGGRCGRPWHGWSRPCSGGRRRARIPTAAVPSAVRWCSARPVAPGTAVCCPAATAPSSTAAGAARACRPWAGRGTGRCAARPARAPCPPGTTGRGWWSWPVVRTAYGRRCTGGC